MESAIFTLNHTQSENFGISLKKLKREKCANTLEFKVINTDDVFPKVLGNLLFQGGGAGRCKKCRVLAKPLH